MLAPGILSASIKLLGIRLHPEDDFIDAAGFTVVMVSFFYVVAGIYMLVEIFISLRVLPSGAYEAVQWARFLPHLG